MQLFRFISLLYQRNSRILRNGSPLESWSRHRWNVCLHASNNKHRQRETMLFSFLQRSNSYAVLLCTVVHKILLYMFSWNWNLTSQEKPCPVFYFFSPCWGIVLIEELLYWQRRQTATGFGSHRQRQPAFQPGRFWLPCKSTNSRRCKSSTFTYFCLKRHTFNSYDPHMLLYLCIMQP